MCIDDNMRHAVEKWGCSIAWSEDKAKLRPDIVIFKLTNNHYKPEAIIQIKVCSVNPKALKDEIEKIKRMAGDGDGGPLRAIIFFFEIGKHKKELKEGFNYIITPENHQEFEKMLQEIDKKLNSIQIDSLE